MQRFQTRYETSLNFENTIGKSFCLQYMLTDIRPSFEVAKKGWILKKIKHLQNQIISVFYLVPVGVILTMPIEDFNKVGSNYNHWFLFQSNL